MMRAKEQDQINKFIHETIERHHNIMNFDQDDDLHIRAWQLIVSILKFAADNGHAIDASVFQEARQIIEESNP